MKRIDILGTLILIAFCSSSLMANAPLPKDDETAKSDADETLDTDKALAAELIGSWRIVSATFDGKPSSVHYGIVTIKHITPTQFTWLSYRPGERNIFRSMGGSWKIEDGKYLESPLYGMQKDFPTAILGRTTAIECDIDDDVFTQTITGSNGAKFIEVWKRIKPGEDPAIAVKPSGE